MMRLPGMVMLLAEIMMVMMTSETGVSRIFTAPFDLLKIR